MGGSYPSEKRLSHCCGYAAAGNWHDHSDSMGSKFVDLELLAASQAQSRTYVESGRLRRSHLKSGSRHGWRPSFAQLTHLLRMVMDGHLLEQRLSAVRRGVMGGADREHSFRSSDLRHAFRPKLPSTFTSALNAGNLMATEHAH